MADRVSGTLEVGTNSAGEVVVNHPDLKPDEHGVGHIVFSPPQARHFAHLLLSKAGDADRETRERTEAEARRRAAEIPVDRSCRVLTDGSPVTPKHREIDPATGQQKGYVVLCDAERAKGFVRPVRETYRHLTCGTTTTMGRKLAETYARDPGFYSGTFCVRCAGHFPLDQFEWLDGEVVGS
jgi:hypothetical protein